jgi:hypothetical protein
VDVLSVIEALPSPVKMESLRRVGRRLFIRGIKFGVIEEALDRGLENLLDKSWHYLSGHRPRLWRGRLLTEWVSTSADVPVSMGEVLLSPSEFVKPPPADWQFIGGTLYVNHPRIPNKRIRISRHAFRESFPVRVRGEPWPVVDGVSDRASARAFALIVREAVPATRAHSCWAALKHGHEATYWISRDRWILVLPKAEDVIITLFSRGNLGSGYRLAE